MTHSPEITVVILNWNGKSWLEKFLPSVLQSTYTAYSVLVVDNGSTDDSVSWLAAKFPEIKCLELPENYGFAEGNNRAIPLIDTPYFALLNSDVEVTPGWLEPLVSHLETNPLVAAVQPKVKLWSDKNSFEYAGAAGGWLDKFGYAFCRGRVFDELEQDEGQYQNTEVCFWATGACLMVRTAVAKKIGLFEGELFAHWEEIDFCWRAWNKGYRISAVPSSEVFHVGGGTLPQGNPRKTFLNVRNSLICLFVNLPSRRRLSVITTRLILDGVWGAKALVSGDWKSIPAIIQGHWAFFARIGYWNKKRKTIYANSLPDSMPSAGYWPKSVVWAHFVNGKKKFSDLF